MSVQERPDELIRLLRPEFAGRFGADNPASLTWGKIMLIPPAGAPVTTYPVTVAGLLAALTAATVAGSMIWVPPGTFNTAITIPANVGLVALGEKTSINGQWTLNSGVVVANIVQTQSGSSGSALSGVVGPSSGIAYMKNCSIVVENTGAGDAYALQGGAGDVWAWNCNLEGTASGIGKGFAIQKGSGNIIVTTAGRYIGSTAAFSGPVTMVASTQQYDSSNVSNPPTQDEASTALGTALADGYGYHAYLDDNGYRKRPYLSLADGLHWWHLLPVKSRGANKAEIVPDSYDLAQVNTTGIREEALVSRVVGGVRYQVYAFFDESGFLSFAKRQLPSTTWTKYTTAISVTGADAHYAPVLGIDPNNYLHVVYNSAGGAGITYRRSTLTIDAFAGVLTATQTMLNHAEETADTGYPKFLHDHLGKLYFTFGHENPSSKNIYFYSYDESTTTWSAAAGTSANGLLIDGLASTPDAIPYGFQVRFDDSGNLHFAWVWRDDYVTDSFNDVCYVKWNRTTFEQADGTAQTVPITRANCETVKSISTGSDLKATNWLDADGNNYPHLVYRYNDGSGNSQIWHSWHNGTSWTHLQLTSDASDHLLWQIAVNRNTNVAYVFWSNSNVEQGLLVYKSGANDFTDWDYQNIYDDEDVDIYGIKFDWQYWNEENIFDLTIEKWTGSTGVLPVNLLEWSDGLENISRIVQMRGTKADIESWKASLEEAAISYATDTEELGIYTNGAWVWISADANTDETVKVSANDTTAGYLNGKLVEGAGIDFTENNDGGNETLTIISDYEVLMADGEATATPLANDDDDDWLYGD